jgi:hypothetical protein
MHNSSSKRAQKPAESRPVESSLEQALRNWAERDQADDAAGRRRLQMQCRASWRRTNLIVEP